MIELQPVSHVRHVTVDELKAIGEGNMLKEVAASRPDAQAFVDSLALLVHPVMFEEDLPDMAVVQSTLAKADSFAITHGFSSLWNKIKRRITPDLSKIENELGELVEVVKSKKLTNDTTVSARDLDFIRSWRVYMATWSDASQNSLLKFVGMTASPNIAAMFAQETDIDVNSQRTASDESRKLVKKMTGRDSPKMTLDEVVAARAKSPDVYSEYLAARRVVTKVANDAIANITRTAGKPVLVSEIIRQLDRLGIEHNLPAGFTGKKDEKGWYTIFDELIDGAPVGDVRMNPSYTKGGSVYVFQNQAPGAKTWQTIYTKAAKSARKDKKYAGVATANENIDKYMTIWRRDLLSKDADNQELGCITELLYLTTSRVGTPGNETDGKATYGLTTILGQHVTFKGSGAGTRARIMYHQKKGSLMIHVLEPTDKYIRKAIELLRTYVDRAGKNGRVFSKDAREINYYIKNRVKLPLSAHGFRHIRGTKLMVEELEKQRAKLGDKPTERLVAAAFKVAAENVGSLLGHTTKNAAGEVKTVGSTATKSYIDPSVSRSWFESYGMRPPRNLESL